MTTQTRTFPTMPTTTRMESTTVVPTSTESDMTDGCRCEARDLHVAIATNKTNRNARITI